MCTGKINDKVSMTMNKSDVYIYSYRLYHLFCVIYFVYIYLFILTLSFILCYLFCIIYNLCDFGMYSNI